MSKYAYRLFGAKYIHEGDEVVVRDNGDAVKGVVTKMSPAGIWVSFDGQTVRFTTYGHQYGRGALRLEYSRETAAEYDRQQGIEEIQSHVRNYLRKLTDRYIASGASVEEVVAHAKRIMAAIGEVKE